MKFKNGDKVFHISKMWYMEVNGYDDTTGMYCCKHLADPGKDYWFNPGELRLAKKQDFLKLDNYTDEELQDFKSAIQEEMERRSYAKKEKLWNAIIEAMDSYVKEFGDIYIITPGTDYNCYGADFSNIGKLRFD